MIQFIDKLSTRNNNSPSWMVGEFVFYMAVGLVTVAVMHGLA